MYNHLISMSNSRLHETGAGPRARLGQNLLPGRGNLCRVPRHICRLLWAGRIRNPVRRVDPRAGKRPEVKGLSLHLSAHRSSRRAPQAGRKAAGKAEGGRQGGGRPAGRRAGGKSGGGVRGIRRRLSEVTTSLVLQARAATRTGRARMTCYPRPPPRRHAAGLRPGPKTSGCVSLARPCRPGYRGGLPGGAGNSRIRCRRRHCREAAPARPEALLHVSFACSRPRGNRPAARNLDACSAWIKTKFAWIGMVRCMSLITRMGAAGSSSGGRLQARADGRGPLWTRVQRIGPLDRVPSARAKGLKVIRSTLCAAEAMVSGVMTGRVPGCAGRPCGRKDRHGRQADPCRSKGLAHPCAWLFPPCTGYRVSHS